MGVTKRPGAALGVLTGINVLNYLDRYMGAALLPLMIPALHLTDSQAGSLQSIFMIVYLLASPLAGWLGDRGPRLKLAAAGVAIWSAATFGSGLASTFAGLMLARALVGVGEASYANVTPSLLADLYPAERRGRVMAIFYVAIPVGSAFGYILGGWIGPALGWQTAFFVAGGPGLLCALALLALREPARGTFDAHRPATTDRSFGQALATLARRPSYWFNTLSQTIYTFGIGGLAYWIPTYFVRERHLTLERATFLFGLVLCVAGILGTALGGVLGDRLARRYAGAYFTFSGVALIASVPFTLLAILSKHPVIFWPAMFVTLLLLFLNTGPLNAAMTNVLPADLRARGFAIYSVAIHLFGDAASPKVIGMVSDRVGLQLPVLLSGLMVSIGGLVLLAGRRHLVTDLQAAAR
jgi:predicted MFS family arabinose efflux permease